MSISDRVLNHLEAWKADEESLLESMDTIEKKADQIGLINEIDTAIQRIELCEKYGIFGASKFLVMPDAYSASVSYRIVCDNESNNPEDWAEVKKDGYEFLLDSGDVAVTCYRW